jgi:IclR family transcriptional regulator, KDG regulon repressor
MASQKHPNGPSLVRAKPLIPSRRAVPSHAIAPTPKPAKQAKPATPPKAVAAAQPPREPSTAALERAIDLLELLAQEGPIALPDLAKKSGCAASTAIRVLRVLQTRGFAVSDEAHKLWRLGTRWNAFGQAATKQGALAATAMPFLAALATAAGENAYLRVRDGMASETVAVHQIDPTLRVYTDVGSRGPLHAGTSRMLLAHAPESVQTQVLTQRLPRFTPATRTDATWIAADLQRIRVRGYLVTSDEVVAGAVSVGAPVRDASGQVVAVIFISAPTMRMRPPRPRALVAVVQDAAAKLSHALGYTRSEALVASASAVRKPSTPTWAVSPAIGTRNGNVVVAPPRA